MPRNPRRLCIGAIVYNEAPYLLEWIAFHLEQGFEHFFLGDHDSDDGTTTLLETLQNLGYVTRLFCPRAHAGNAQRKVYAQILELARRRPSLVAFIDADEYLVPTHERERAGQAIRELLDSPQIGALGINWRSFGSSGRIEPGQGLVVERFTRCNAPDALGNRHIKSVVKPEAVETAWVHRCTLLPGYRYTDAAGAPVPFDRMSGFARDIPAIDGRVRVHHYIVKSYREFADRKAFRGRATRGPAHVRGTRFFHTCDKGGYVDYRALAFNHRVRRRMAELEQALSKTVRGHRIGAIRVVQSGNTVEGSFVSEPPLVDAHLCLTRYFDLGHAEEQAIGLHTQALELDASTGALLPTTSGIGSLASHRFRIDTASGTATPPLALRLRLAGHPLDFLDTRAALTPPLAITLPPPGGKPQPAEIEFAGGVEQWTGGRVKGWVRHYAHAEPVKVRLFAKGSAVAIQIANRFRPDLLFAHKHPTGHCGFDFDLRPLKLPAGTACRVRVAGHGHVLARFKPAPGTAPGPG
ncbi:MAG: glycosyltransferase family 92 protein [Panacagrimonas sp.]